MFNFRLPDLTKFAWKQFSAAMGIAVSEDWRAGHRRRNFTTKLVIDPSDHGGRKLQRDRAAEPPIVRFTNEAPPHRNIHNWLVQALKMLLLNPTFESSNTFAAVNCGSKLNWMQLTVKWKMLSPLFNEPPVLSVFYGFCSHPLQPHASQLPCSWSRYTIS